MYCPVFGISVSYNEEGTREYGNKIDHQYIRWYTDGDVHRMLEIGNNSYQNNTDWEGMGAAESAKEALEMHVTSQMQLNESEYCYWEYSELGGIVETEIGGYSFLGRGLSSKQKDDSSGSVDYEWLFLSDDIAWTISVDTDEEAYEPCLSVIESIQ